MSWRSVNVSNAFSIVDTCVSMGRLQLENKGLERVDLTGVYDKEVLLVPLINVTNPGQQQPGD